MATSTPLCAACHERPVRTDVKRNYGLCLDCHRAKQRTHSLNFRRSHGQKPRRPKATICKDCRSAPIRTDIKKTDGRCHSCYTKWNRLRQQQYTVPKRRLRRLAAALIRARDYLARDTHSSSAYAKLADRAKQRGCPIDDLLTPQQQRDVEHEWNRMLALPQNRNCHPMHRVQLKSLAIAVILYGGWEGISHRARVVQQHRKQYLNLLTHGSRTNIPRPFKEPKPLSSNHMVSRPTPTPSSAPMAPWFTK